MAVDLSSVGAELGRGHASWTTDDCLLYALTVGCGCDELSFVTENWNRSPQQVLPTFPLVGRRSHWWSALLLGADLRAVPRDAEESAAVDVQARTAEDPDVICNGLVKTYGPTKPIIAAGEGVTRLAAAGVTPRPAAHPDKDLVAMRHSHQHDDRSMTSRWGSGCRTDSLLGF